MHGRPEDVLVSLKGCQSIWMTQATEHIDYHSYSQDSEFFKGPTLPCCVGQQKGAVTHAHGEPRKTFMHQVSKA